MARVYSYPAVGQAHPHAPSSVAGQSYQYDANGNLVQGGNRTYNWNADNMPVGIVGPGGMANAESYTYDPDRRAYNSHARLDHDRLLGYVGRRPERA